MQRHITDHPARPDDAARLRAFIRLERRELPSITILALQRRPVAPQGSSALRHFLRIDRGLRAQDHITLR